MTETTKRIRAAGGKAERLGVDGVELYALCDGYLDMELSRFPDIKRGIGDGGPVSPCYLQGLRLIGGRAEYLSQTLNDMRWGALWRKSTERPLKLKRGEKPSSVIVGISSRLGMGAVPQAP